MNTPTQTNTPANSEARWLSLSTWFFGMTALYWILSVIFQIGFYYQPYGNTSLTTIGNPFCNFIGIFTPIGPLNILHPFEILIGLPVVATYIVFVGRYLRKKNLSTTQKIIANLLALLILTSITDILSAGGPIRSIMIFITSCLHYFTSGCEIIDFGSVTCVS